MCSKIDNILKTFAPITLEQIQEIRLMDRLDYKHVAPVSILPSLLEEISSSFLVQTNNDVRISSYATQYFDTPELNCFLMHQNGKLNRQKIRIRSYADSDLAFLEVKNKNNKGRKRKIRVKINTPRIKSIAELNGEQKFLNEHSLFAPDLLMPVMENSFKRITLINRRKTERITIDTQISFLNYATNNKKTLDNVMAIELKQNGREYSDFKAVLEQLRIRPVSFSKYCTGMVMTNPDVKYNRFKKRLRRINKLVENDTNLS